MITSTSKVFLFPVDEIALAKVRVAPQGPIIVINVDLICNEAARVFCKNTETRVKSNT